MKKKAAVAILAQVNKSSYTSVRFFLTKLSNGEVNEESHEGYEGYEGFNEEGRHEKEGKAREQDCKRQARSCCGLQRPQREDLHRPEKERPDQEQERQDRDP